MNLSRFEKLASVVLLLALAAMVATYFINPFHANSRDPSARVMGFMIFRIPSRSMLPTLRPGTIFAVSTVALADRDPRPGEIVVFRYPPDPEWIYVKRVIAVGGQTIEVRAAVPRALILGTLKSRIL